MTETIVKEKLCDICGIAVREGSMFCYNCGGAVEQAGVVAVTEVQEPSGTQLQPNDLNDPENEAKPRAKDGRPPRKRTRKRTIEPRSITWEEPEGFGQGFLLSAAILILLSVLLIVIAFYLR